MELSRAIVSAVPATSRFDLPAHAGREEDLQKLDAASYVNGEVLVVDGGGGEV